MSRFARPVRAGDLLSSPELLLRYPTERDGRIGSADDEGVGSGFDLGSPRAYAERWFDTSDPPTSVQDWFEHELTSLGWRLAHDADGFRVYKRDLDESLGVTIFGVSVRVHMEVEGRWPDGGSDYRPT